MWNLSAKAILTTGILLAMNMSAQPAEMDSGAREKQTGPAAETAAEVGKRVEIRDGWFHVDGEPFFVKGQGYVLGGGRGSHPHNRKFDQETMEYDMGLLKDAGFNTVRSWNPYKTEELRVLKDHGMMVIQGSWFHFPRYLRDAAYAKKSRENLAEVIRMSKPFDNILFHSICNEPAIEGMLDAGMDAYNQACRELVAAAKKEDPDCLLAYSHCMKNEFLDQSAWDLVFFNNYMYAGETIKKAMKYRGHVEWLIREHSPQKPFVLGEFGLSVSPSGQGNMGYGGNTLEEQRDGDIYMYQSMIDAGGQGGCLFMWRDGWSKYGDPNTHDDHSEEWYGILGIEDWDSDPRGTPRPAYYAFREYNQLILTEPRQMVAYNKNIPVHAYVTEKVQKLRCRLDGGEWVGMEKTSPSWRRTTFSGLAKGRHVVEVAATLDLDPPKEIMRRMDVVVGDPETALPRLKLTTDKKAYDYGDTIVVVVSAVSEQNVPVAGLPVVMTITDHRVGASSWFDMKTDDNGRVEKSIPLYTDNTFITLAAGADSRPYGVPFRMTDAMLVEVRKAKEYDLKALTAGGGVLVEGFEYESDETLADVRGRVLSAKGSTYRIERGIENVHEGSAALRLRFEPSEKGGWGYTEIMFDSPRDLSDAVGAGVRVFGDGSGNKFSLRFIDQDGERWFEPEQGRINFTGWRQLLFSTMSLRRDPNDGIRDGDGKPNMHKVGGLAFIVNAKHGKSMDISIDDLRAYQAPTDGGRAVNQ